MQKHIILTNGRSGSNYLSNLLNTHPQIVNYGEVLGKWTLPYKLHTRLGLGGRSETDYLDYILTSPSFFYMGQLYSVLSHFQKGKMINFKRWSQVKTIGIKDFSINFVKRNLKYYLRDNQDILVINLYRENQLKRLVSLTMMGTTGVIAIDKKAKKESLINKVEEKKNQKIYLKPEEVIQKLEIYEAEIEEQISLIAEVSPEKILNIQYEDLFASSGESQDYYAGKVFKFLEVEPIATKGSHKKILSNNLPDIIDNYDELYSALKNTRFVKYFES